MSKGRQKTLTRLQENGRFDVIVVGGGVNGIGVYRELALQGLRVLLVERNDFCSGCSAAPSRMIHGGLRYLENGEFALVRESLRERDALLKNAPHFVRPLPTVIPITSVFSGLFNAAMSFMGRPGRPSRRGAVPIKLGLGLYDWVTRKRRLVPRHKFLSAQRSRAKWPELTKTTKFAAVYYDAWISHPERLCIEMIKDVTDIAPECVALNYAELNPDAANFTLNCQQNGGAIPVTAKAIVNATGAWVDSTIQSLGIDAPEKLVSGTKGSHLILDNPKLREALNGHMVYFENVDGRVCIAFPYQGRVLAGSTDIRVDRATKVRCEADEREYILNSLQRVFPQVSVAAEQVVFTYSGIRPLPESEQGFTGRISRGHSVKRLVGSVPQFCMVGGKWTTFRAFAEQTADEVLRELGIARKTGTENLPIGGGKGYRRDGQPLKDELMGLGRISAERADHLVGLYGATAKFILQFSQNRTDDRSIGENSQYSSAEIAYLIQSEHVETLSDIVLRRTDLAISGSISTEQIDTLGRLMGEELNLSQDELTRQRKSLIDELADYYDVSPAMLSERSKIWRKLCA